MRLDELFCDGEGSEIFCDGEGGELFCDGEGGSFCGEGGLVSVLRQINGGVWISRVAPQGLSEPSSTR